MLRQVPQRRLLRARLERGMPTGCGQTPRTVRHRQGLPQRSHQAAPLPHSPLAEDRWKERPLPGQQVRAWMGLLPVATVRAAWGGSR